MNRYKNMLKISIAFLGLLLLPTSKIYAETVSETSNTFSNDKLNSSVYNLSEKDNPVNFIDNPIAPNYSAVYYYNQQTPVNIARNPLRLIPQHIYMNHPYYGPVEGTVYPINAADWDGTSNMWLYRGSLYRIDGSPMPISIRMIK